MGVVVEKRTFSKNPNVPVFPTNGTGAWHTGTVSLGYPMLLLRSYGVTVLTTYNFVVTGTEPYPSALQVLLFDIVPVLCC